MRSAIVTGGEGFIGRYLVKALRRQGTDVRTLGRRRSADAAHIVLEAHRWNPPMLGRILEDQMPDCIFHLAGAACGTARELFHVNVGLTQALIRALLRTGLRPLLVIAGSAAEYGSGIRDGEPVRESTTCAPLSAYGASKRAQTREALAYADATRAPVLVARIFNALGPGLPSHLAVGDFACQIASMPRRRGTLQVGNLDVRRDMMDVEHTAALLCNLARNRAARGVVNVCSGQAPLLRELVEMLIEACGRDVAVAVDRARIRAGELHAIIGSTDRLTKLGCPPPPTDFPALITRIWQNMEASVACAS